MFDFIESELAPFQHIRNLGPNVLIPSQNEFLNVMHMSIVSALQHCMLLLNKSYLKLGVSKSRAVYAIGKTNSRPATSENIVVNFFSDYPE